MPDRPLVSPCRADARREMCWQQARLAQRTGTKHDANPRGHRRRIPEAAGFLIGIDCRLHGATRQAPESGDLTEVDQRFARGHQEELGSRIEVAFTGSKDTAHRSEPGLTLGLREDDPGSITAKLRVPSTPEEVASSLRGSFLQLGGLILIVEVFCGKGIVNRLHELSIVSMEGQCDWQRRWTG